MTIPLRLITRNSLRPGTDNRNDDAVNMANMNTGTYRVAGEKDVAH